jgi:hypothetical protein
VGAGKARLCSEGILTPPGSKAVMIGVMIPKGTVLVERLMDGLRWR